MNCGVVDLRQLPYDDHQACQLDKSQKDLIVVFAANDNATKVLDPAIQPLDLVAVLAPPQLTPVLSRRIGLGSIDAGRSDRCRDFRGDPARGRDLRRDHQSVASERWATVGHSAAIRSGLLQRGWRYGFPPRRGSRDHRPRP